MNETTRSLLEQNEQISTKADLDSSEMPFVESPRYKKFKFEKTQKKFRKYCDELNQNSFCVVDLDVESIVLDQANIDIDEAIEANRIKVNSRAYHYNPNPRIVEAWKFSKSIRELALNKTLLDILRFGYQSEPVPFSTINFLRGTEQPLHSDEIHFGSIPHRYLTGCWIALEDINPDSGPLSIAVGSHKLPIFSFEQLGLNTPRNESDFKKNYSIYEDWVKTIIEKNNLEVVTPKLKKGQCIIWLSNSLHGAYRIKDKKLTRKSLVVHYHYKKCEKLFYPSYSNLKTGKLIPRTLKNLDIREQNTEL